MAFRKTYNKIIYGGCLLTASILTGCGGSDGESNAPDIVNQAPTVEIVGSNRATEREVTTFSADAMDIDGKIASYQWSVDTDTVELIAADSAQLSFITPSISEKMSFTVSLIVTDNDGLTATSSTVFTAIPIKKELLFFGQIIDEEVVDADVTFDIGDESFNTTANGLGYYDLEVIVDERNFGELIKITALGAIPAQAKVKLVSLLASFNTVYQQQSSLGFITITENFGVNVTNLSTAQYLVAQQLNDKAPITDEDTYNEIYPNLYDTSRESMLEIAAVLKAVVDVRGKYTEYALAENVADTFALLTDPSAYTNVLNMLQADGDLYNETVRTIVADPDISEFPDTDNDTVFDIFDQDIDGDGYLNIIKDKAGQDIEDIDTDDLYFDHHPYDDSQYLPYVSQLTLKDFDEENARNHDNALLGCLNAMARRSEYISNTYDLRSMSNAQLDVPVTEFTALNCAEYKKYGDISSALKYFVNVTSVDFTNASDISGLAQLKHLPITKLTLAANSSSAALADSNKTYDFSFLMNMPGLTELNLANTTFKNIDHLENNTQLIKLDLSGTAVTNLTALTGFTELSEVYVAKTLITDLSPLNDAFGLISLSASYSKVVTLPNFFNMPQLRELDIDNNEIVNVDSLAALTNFTKLDLSNNNIVNIDSLAALTKLTELDASNNNIVNVAPLKGLVELTTLNLSDNNISGSIDDLSKLTALTVLSIDNNHISNIAGVSEMTQLTELRLANNELLGSTVISPLAALESLNQLDLSDNSIRSVDTLLNWQVLPAKVDLRNNQLLCELQVAINDRAKADGTTLLIGDDDAEEQCIVPEEFDIKTGGPFGVDPDGEAARTPLTVLNLSTQVAGISSNGSSSLGITDGIACISKHAGEEMYPICFESNHALTNDSRISCKAEANSLQAQCQPEDTVKYGTTEVWPGVAFTFDFEQRVLPGNKFAASFEDRLLLQLLKSSKSDHSYDLSCSAVSDGLSTCIMTADEENHPNSTFTGTISWQQPHNKPYIPRCSGNAGDTIAVCYPAYDTVIPREDGNVDKTATPFTIDVRDITYRPINGEACEGGIGCGGF
ncbi:leucine-rich repeat domain-containing protein [Thalassotalea fonticola]|uniref:Leucine-rich repeat domain-containing protein n=1 Tax=Thalassotalea fonticola TaxID=3065649 RepID=A0ABZ0GSI3_9GAMM|nr:leucine-rich repeat domain-containing protein [Colwelliaceae bacterium S1-1]